MESKEHEILIYEVVTCKKMEEWFKNSKLKYNSENRSLKYTGEKEYIFSTTLDRKKELTKIRIEISNVINIESLEILNAVRIQVEKALNINHVIYETISDPLSEQLALLSFPKIYSLETQMRKFITLNFSQVHDKNWQEKTIPDENKTVAKSHKEHKNYIKEMDFYTLINIVFETPLWIVTQSDGKTIYFSNDEIKTKDIPMNVTGLERVNAWESVAKKFNFATKSYNKENISTIKDYRNDTYHCKALSINRYKRVINLIETCTNEVIEINKKIYADSSYLSPQLEVFANSITKIIDSAVPSVFKDKDLSKKLSEQMINMLRIAEINKLIDYEGIEEYFKQSSKPVEIKGNTITIPVSSRRILIESENDDLENEKSEEVD